jgi:DNA-binding NarL/FixJ family response regulator
MTTILITATTPVDADTLVPAAAEGKVKFHRERANGTTRRVQFLAEGTAEREVAEWVVVQRGEGRTMKAIAAEMHVSVPTVRRLINALMLTWEVEEDAEDLLDTVVVATVEGPLKADGTF